MNNRKIVAAISLLATISLAAAQAHEPPEVHLVGDRWTAWDPPTSFPEGAQVYTIERGDTLWDLAGRFYGNPYLWPQIWEQNRYILDAHWIYPGDPLIVGFEVTPIESVQAAGAEAEGAEDGMSLAQSSSAPVPLGSKDDLECSGYIGDFDEQFPFTIIGSEYEALSPTLVPAVRATGVGDLGPIAAVKLELTLGDVVYLDGGRMGGMQPGDLLTVVNPDKKIKHPVTGDAIGRFYGFLGRIRVLSVQEDSAIGEVVYGCVSINVGATLKPYEPEPIPLARRGLQVGVNEPVSGESLLNAPMIVHSERGIVTIGRDHLVYLDLGDAAASAAPGDIYSIYRVNPHGHPPIVVGELGILSVKGRSSLAKVIESRYAVYVGDRLEPKQ